jgi:Uncharacterised nucleotidyltransferase
LAGRIGRRRIVMYGCWPAEGQALLLRAALLDASEATRAWTDWLSGHDPRATDAGSRRLLPLVYRNVTSAGGDPALLGCAADQYRRSWLKNHKIVERLAGVLRAFREAGIPTMVLKGLPLGLRYYQDLGLRPMADADVLVREPDPSRVLRAIQAAGLTAASGPITWPPRFSAARAFRDGMGLEVDVHCRVLHECLRDGADDELWAAATPIDVGGAPTVALVPADQLLHVLVHGFRRSRVSPVRWVADAATVVRASGSALDWDRLVVQARTRDLARIVLAGLGYLRSSLALSIPTEVLRSLSRTPVSVCGRLEVWARPKVGAVPVAVEAWCDYTRSIGREPGWQGTGGFLRYVADRLGAPSPWHLPAAAARWRRRRNVGDQEQPTGIDKPPLL